MMRRKNNKNVAWGIGVCYLLNSKLKTTFFLLMLIFGVLSLGDYAVLTLKIPSFDNLRVTNGLVYKGVKGVPYGRSGKPFMLKTDKNINEFTCNINTRMNKSCINKEDFSLYENKPAKIWWYQARTFGWMTTNRLLQLEVNGKLIVGYNKQKQIYLLNKSQHVYMFFIIAILAFIFLQIIDTKVSDGTTRVALPAA